MFQSIYEGIFTGPSLGQGAAKVARRYAGKCVRCVCVCSVCGEGTEREGIKSVTGVARCHACPKPLVHGSSSSAARTIGLGFRLLGLFILF